MKFKALAVLLVLVLFGTVAGLAPFPVATAQAVPTIYNIDPTSAYAGAPGFGLSVYGSNFTLNSVVRWNGSARSTQVYSVNILTASIPASDLESPGTATVTVFTPGAGESNPVTFTIKDLYPPGIRKLMPDWKRAGSPGFQLEVYGYIFLPRSVVRWNGVDRATTYISEGVLLAQIPASDVASVGTASVTVFTSGVGESNPATFTIISAGTWSPQTSFTGQNIGSLDAVDSTRVWAVAGGGSMEPGLESGIGFYNGTSWTMSRKEFGLTDVDALNAANVWAVGEDKVLYYNGTTWSTAWSGSAWLDDVYAAATNRVWATGPGGRILYYNGTSWSFQTSGTTTRLYGVDGFNASNVWAVGDGIILFYNGTSWSVQHTVGDSIRLNNVCALDSTHVWAVGYDVNTALGVIYFYDGTSWTRQDSGYINPLFDVDALDANHVWAVGRYGKIMFYDGTDWTFQDSGTDDTFYSVSALDDRNAWAAGQDGMIRKFSGDYTPHDPRLPRITWMLPSQIVAGSRDFELDLRGENFNESCRVLWNGQVRPAWVHELGGGEIMFTALIPASDVAEPGVAQISIWDALKGVVGPAVEFVISNPLPSISSIDPATKRPGDPAFELRVYGSGFVPGSVVRWNGEPRDTIYVSSSRLRAAIPASDIADEGEARVTVYSPSPGGGESNAVTFYHYAEAPMPSITSISPKTKEAGGGDFSLTVRGSNFVPRSVVRWNGEARETTYVSDTELTAAIPASDIATPGTASVTVFTSPYGGGTSNAARFTIHEPWPEPTVTSIDPDTGVNDRAVDVTITGSGFQEDAVAALVKGWPPSAIIWASNVVVKSDTELTCTFDLTDAELGTWHVGVMNTDGKFGLLPDGFNVISGYPIPSMTSIDPESAMAGDPGFTLTVTGSNFVENRSVVRWNGEDRPTTYVSDTELTAEIPASDLEYGGIASVTVFTPAPGGGTSEARPFTVNNLVPVLESIDPDFKVAGDPGFTLEVTGRKFTPNSVVRWNGEARATTFVSKTELTALIPASDVASVGTAEVTVFTPAPGGGTSEARTLSIIPEPPVPVPVLDSIEPDARTAGSPGFILTLNGSNFWIDSVVMWNGEPRATTFLSGNRLTAVIPASDIALYGTASVTVFNPGPGGGTSEARPFTINNPVPVLDSIDPDTARAEGPGFGLTVRGSNFVPSSVVRWNGEPRATTYASATQVVALIRTSDIATAGTAEVTVFNPAPGGGTTDPATFTIEAWPAPTVTSITPNRCIQGYTVNITNLAGSDFRRGATVRIEKVGGTQVYNATKVVVVSPTKITCTINLQGTGAPLGKYDVVVRNPDGREGRLAGGFSVTDACGGGGGTMALGLGLMMGLLSLGGLRRRLLTALLRAVR